MFWAAKDVICAATLRGTIETFKASGQVRRDKRHPRDRESKTEEQSQEQEAEEGEEEEEEVVVVLLVVALGGG